MTRWPNKILNRKLFSQLTKSTVICVCSYGVFGYWQPNPYDFVSVAYAIQLKGQFIKALLWMTMLWLQVNLIFIIFILFLFTMLIFCFTYIPRILSGLSFPLTKYTIYTIYEYTRTKRTRVYTIVPFGPFVCSDIFTTTPVYFPIGSFFAFPWFWRLHWDSCCTAVYW